MTKLDILVDDIKAYQQTLQAVTQRHGPRDAEFHYRYYAGDQRRDDLPELLPIYNDTYSLASFDSSPIFVYDRRIPITVDWALFIEGTPFEAEEIYRSVRRGSELLQRIPERLYPSWVPSLPPLESNSDDETKFNAWNDCVMSWLIRDFWRVCGNQLRGSRLLDWELLLVGHRMRKGAVSDLADIKALFQRDKTPRTFQHVAEATNAEPSRMVAPIRFEDLAYRSGELCRELVRYLEGIEPSVPEPKKLLDAASTNNQQADTSGDEPELRKLPKGVSLQDAAAILWDYDTGEQKRRVNYWNNPERRKGKRPDPIGKEPGGHGRNLYAVDELIRFLRENVTKAYIVENKLSSRLLRLQRPVVG